LVEDFAIYKSNDWWCLYDEMKRKIIGAGLTALLIAVAVLFLLRPRAASRSIVVTQNGQIKLIATNSLWKATVVMNLPKNASNNPSRR
jgi:hypothetical protein